MSEDKKSWYGFWGDQCNAIMFDVKPTEKLELQIEMISDWIRKGATRIELAGSEGPNRKGSGSRVILSVVAHA